MRAELDDLIPHSGRALDVACGRGPQTAWLASRGLNVVALDVSDVAIALTADAAEACGVGHRVDARQHDLEAGLPSGLHDLDVIVCQRFRNREILESLDKRLRPNGLAFVTVLSTVGLGREPGRFHAPAGELTEIFETTRTEIIWQREAEGLASIVIRRR